MLALVRVSGVRKANALALGRTSKDAWTYNSQHIQALHSVLF